MTIPRQLPDQPFEAHQREMAEWIGAGSVEEMNDEHDGCHSALCDWLGAPSFSLMIAQGIPLSAKRKRLAGLEEEAVLCLQRWVTHLRKEGEFAPLSLENRP